MNVEVCVEIGNPSRLVQSSPGVYPFVVMVQDVAFQPLDSPHIANVTSFTRSIVSGQICFSVPIADGNYIIPDIRITIYSGTSASVGCCLSSQIYTLVNNTVTCTLDLSTSNPHCETVDIAIVGGTPAYSYSVKEVGNETERFLSISGGVITFTPIRDGAPHTYRIKAFDSVPCEDFGDITVTCCNLSWEVDFEGKYYYVHIASPTAVPSGYSIVRRPNQYYAVDGTRLYNSDYSSSVLLTTPGLWRNTGYSGSGDDPDDFFSGPMNWSSIWTGVNDGTDRPVGMWIGFSYCASGFVAGKVYYIGLEADNIYRFLLNGNVILSNLDDVSTHFRTWRIYPVLITTPEVLITMEAQNTTAVAAFACVIYDNTEAEILAATDVTDLNIVFDSVSRVGGKFDTGGNSNGAQWGYQCPNGYSYNPCTNQCERYEYCVPS